MSSIVGPIAPYSNPPIEPQFYQPKVFQISDITIGKTTVIETTTDHDYVVGQLVRLIIPPGFGCRILNYQTGYVISIPNSDEVTLDIYSLGIDPFVSSMASNQPQIVAVGDINSGVVNSSGRTSVGTFIQGSFINISPQ